MKCSKTTNLTIPVIKRSQLSKIPHLTSTASANSPVGSSRHKDNILRPTRQPVRQEGTHTVKTRPASDSMASSAKIQVTRTMRLTIAMVVVTSLISMYLNRNLNRWLWRLSRLNLRMQVSSNSQWMHRPRKETCSIWTNPLNHKLIRRRSISESQLKQMLLLRHRLDLDSNSIMVLLSSKRQHSHCLN